MTNEKAIQMLQAHKFPNPTEAWQMLNNEALDLAIESLSADKVEVVRCKDCIHYESDGGALMVCRIDDMVVDETDYCSYAERREP